MFNYVYGSKNIRPNCFSLIFFYADLYVQPECARL